jgi:adenosylcobinamide-GDP ribazoletransferase
LIVSVCLRAAALASVTPLPGAAALLIAHSSARGAIAFALAFSSYARKEGTGALVAPGISASRFAVTAGVSLAIALAFGLLSGFAAGVAGFAAAGLVLWRFQRRIGGYTGDCLGAMEQAAEIGVLLVLSAAWSAS